MKSTILILLIFTVSLKIKAQNLYFPPVSGTDWETVPPSSFNWCEDKIDSLNKYLESKNTKAFILLKDGKIVIEKYFGTFTADSSWYWASAGKSVTAFLVGLAQQDHYLSIDDTVSHHIGTGWTNCTEVQEEKITIKHLLTMTSGMDDHVPDNYCTLDTCLNCIAYPGTRWAYHTGAYSKLDDVMENATGQSMNVFMSQKVKNPTGMTGLFVNVGYNHVFYSKARSMARFGLLMLNKGNWDGNQIMTDTDYFNQMVNTSQDMNKSYGYLWWLNGKASYMVPTLQIVFPGSLNPHAPQDMFAALGKNGQIINVVPSQNLVYVRMGNAPGVGEVPAAFNDTIWQKVNDLVCSPAAVYKSSDHPKELKVYPNPSYAQSTVALTGKQYDLAVFDSHGRIIDQRKDCMDAVILDTGEYPEGIYQIRLQTTDGELYSRKLVVSRE